MSLRLVYRATTSVPVDVGGLLPGALRGLSCAEIERIEVFHGNRREPLAEFFSVSGGADGERIDFEGDLSGVHRIGAALTGGAIHVAGSAGRHVGSEMTGGEIHVHGGAGDWVGGEMHGGLIHVRGGAGNLVGAAYRGSRHGMTGGAILIEGAAGDEVGHTLRRGLIAVGGCRDFVGINMIAGTILVFGACGLPPGAGMRRGTIGLLGDEPPALLPTFRAGSRDRPLALQLVFRHLRQLGYPVPQTHLDSPYRMYHGDLVSIGRGEVLLPEDDSP